MSYCRTCGEDFTVEQIIEMLKEKTSDMEHYLQEVIKDDKASQDLIEGIKKDIFNANQG